MLSLSCLFFVFPAVLAMPFQSPVDVAPGFTADVISNNLTAPRGVIVDSEQNVLVVERGVGVSAFTLENDAWTKTVVIQNPDVTHGIELDGGRLLVSTASEVTAYIYDADTKTATDPFPFVTGLPADGELTTHALLLQRDEQGITQGIYVGSGPLTNIDPTARDPSSGRSQVRLVPFPEIQITIFPPPPLPWSLGEIVAYGIRNPAGFAFAPSATPSLTSDLYVVENGASIDGVTGVAPDFANDNPADELIVVDRSTGARSYGFPDCSTVWDPVGTPYQQGDQFSLQLDPARDDAWCQQQTNNQPPSLIFQAHSAPLDITFAPSGTSALVSFHGSFDRIPPTGYGVVRVPYPLTGDYSFVVQATDLTNPTRIRPAGVAFNAAGRLFVTSDTSNELFVVDGPF